jgi:Transposase DDE domain
VKGFLHKMLSAVMHKKRLVTLVILVMTVLKSKNLSLSGLGRAMDLPIKERSGIRRVDRFLGNGKLYKEREIIHEMIIKKAIGSATRPDIIVDWSNIPNTTHHTLRASLVAKGRAITLYEEVHPEKKLGNKKVQTNLLKKLKKLLPIGCRPTIITDAGFHNDWFKEIVKLGWDYLGRIRKGSGKKYFQETEWKDCANLFKKATSTPKYIGKVEFCKKNPITTYLYLFKGKSKRRKSLNRAGKKRQDTDAIDYRKAAREPWLLATSLAMGYCMTKKVVKKYSTRMQIEEGFRDLKSSRYGFGFENAYSKTPARIEILLLVAMLASFIAWLTGYLAEKNGLHLQFQSNTVKNRRVLSLFFLGCQVIRRKIKIPINMLENAINVGLCYEA